jgi:hypothetical protein
MNAKPTPDLGLAIPERWTVRTIYKHQSKKEREAKLPPEERHHELCYGGCCIEKETGERGLKRLREMSDLFNRMKVAPRDRAVQCLADESGSIENRLAKQNRRAANYTQTVVRK